MKLMKQKTFEENAIIKVKTVPNFVGLSDDLVLH